MNTSKRGVQRIAAHGLTPKLADSKGRGAPAVAVRLREKIEKAASDATLASPTLSHAAEQAQQDAAQSRHDRGRGKGRSVRIVEGQNLQQQQRASRKKLTANAQNSEPDEEQEEQEEQSQANGLDELDLRRCRMVTINGSSIDVSIIEKVLSPYMGKTENHLPESFLAQNVDAAINGRGNENVTNVRQAPSRTKGRTEGRTEGRAEASSLLENGPDALIVHLERSLKTSAGSSSVKTMEAVEFVSRVRFGLVPGISPFVPIIAFGRLRNHRDVNTILMSGVDALAMQPLDSERLTHCLFRIIQDRKPFLVSKHYIGPLRTDFDVEEVEDLIDPPNLLAIKSKPGQNSARALQKEILQAQEDMDEALMRANSAVIRSHARNLVRYLDVACKMILKTPSEEQLLTTLERIESLCSIILRRVSESKFDSLRGFFWLARRVARAVIDKDPKVSVVYSHTMLRGCAQIIRETLETDKPAFVKIPHEIALQYSRIGSNRRNTGGLVRSLEKVKTTNKPQNSDDDHDDDFVDASAKTDVKPRERLLNRLGLQERR